MATVVRLMVGVLVACALLGTVLIASDRTGGDEAATSATSDGDSEDAAEFALRFKLVRITNVLTGKGGMSLRQAAALLGEPKPRNITEEISPGVTRTDWHWQIWRNDQVTIYTVGFINGRTASKSIA